jgi:acyl carrier protein
MTREAVIERTRSYINENFLYMRRDVVLADDDSLLENGIVDSMGVMELVAFLHGEFGVDIEDEDITEENLGSLQAIGRYVSAKAGSRAQVA